MLFRSFVLVVVHGLLALSAAASAVGPFSQSRSLNFYREVASRDIAGLGLRSDGRLIAGPVLQELAGSPREDLWWDLTHLDANRWLVATGPNGRVLQIELDSTLSTYTASNWGDSSGNHVFVIERVDDDLFAGGTNPDGSVVLWNAAGDTVAEVDLPADSVLDLVWDQSRGRLLVATGNPGALYDLDPQQMSRSPSDAALADRGVELRGEIRDRNLRRLALTPDGTVIGGSAPSGNLYRFEPGAEDPVILLDQESGEVTDIFIAENGDIFATLVMASGNSTRRVMQSSTVQADEEPDEKKDNGKSPAPSIFEAPPIDAFTGRSELILIPDGTGIPRSVSSRHKMAMYRIVRYGDLLLIGGGDDGEFIGYDPVNRRALSFPGSNSAQINDITPLGTAGEFLLLTNNPAGLARLSFDSPGSRLAQTGSLSLQTPSHVGAVRFNRLREIAAEDLKVFLRANRGRDAVEGWTPWQQATREDDVWRVEDLIGVNVQIRIELPADMASTAELDQAELFFLPLNRRPVLRSFRIISPNFALIPRGDGSPATTTLTLGQVINSSPNASPNADDQKRQALHSSNLVPQPGTQVVTWTVSDPDGDRLNSTFSVRRTDDDEWIELAVGPDRGWLQFDRRSLAEGTYFTRLTIAEEAPRSPAARQTVEFATDDLVIDLSPPVLDAVDLSAQATHLTVRVAVTDRLTPLAGIRLSFNNGHVVELSQPADGMLDAKSEQFVMEVDHRLIADATAVEVYATDQADNTAVRRLKLE